ncbi:hypothetical protein GCM10007421_00850 [Halopseudomonas oceani]|jgi:hypothetical protein|nr:PilZ domain-containing protein [Halopseudomonas oceani]GGE30990.1 hypothetical protein GCM10007421_00850 [Halopseudomonas oceani]
MHVIPDSNQGPSIEQRRIPRHHLSAYLCVYNSRNGRPIGYIGNISRDGIMLICSLPVMLNQEYDLELQLPDLDDPLGSQRLVFRARSHWCRADVTPGHYDCGFSVIANREAFAGLAHALQRYFRFGQLADA